MNKKENKTSFTISSDMIYEMLEEQLSARKETITIPANAFINTIYKSESQKLQADTLIIGFGMDGLPVVNFCENEIPTNTTVISIDYDEEQLYTRGSTNKLLLSMIPSLKLPSQRKVSNKNLIESLLETVNPKLIIFAGDLVSPEIHHTLNIITKYSKIKEIPSIGFFFTPTDFEYKHTRELSDQIKKLVTDYFSGYYFIDKNELFHYIDAKQSLENIMEHVTRTLSSIIVLTIKSAQKLFDKGKSINYQNNSILIRTAPDPINMIDAFFEIKKLIKENYKVNIVGILTQQLNLMCFFKDEFRKIIPKVDLQMNLHKENCIVFVVFGQYTH